MLTGLRAVELFVLAAFFRVVLMPLDIGLEAIGLSTSVSPLSAVAVFLVAYSVVTYRRSLDLLPEEWIAIGLVTSEGFIPREWAVTALFVGLMTMGWMWHIRGGHR